MNPIVQNITDQFSLDLRVALSGLVRDALGLSEELPSVLAKPLVPLGAELNGLAPVNGTKPRPKPSRKGSKRDPKELAGLVVQLRAYIAKHPNLGIEAISEGMGVSTKELTLPVKKLIASGDLKTRGQRRATKYSVKGRD